MQIYDHRKQEWLIRPLQGVIVGLEGCRESGSVSATLCEGYTVTIYYSEVESLFKAMEEGGRAWQV